LVLLFVGVPLFLRMPLTNDTELFDLHAELVRSGGVLYRDLLEPNLPGVVWVHLAVRAVLGDSPEAMRLFDLLVFAGILALLARLVALAGGSSRAALWSVVGGAGFYLSVSEWCHCQRDTWMLLPALGALCLRVGTLQRWESSTATRVFARGGIEGVLWGLAVWIKPYALLPAAAAWLAGHRTRVAPLGRVDLSPHYGRRVVLMDAAGLLAGGLAVGAVGIVWLVQHGCWPAFLETLREWNPRYFAAGREHWTLPRLCAMVLRLSPWFLLHLVAVPLSLLTLAGCWRRSPGDGNEGLDRRLVISVSSAAYLGWTFQAFFLQHLFDYVYVPSVLLAGLVLAGFSARAAVTSRRRLRFAWTVFAVLALASSPLLRQDRLRLWDNCLSADATPRLRDQLAHFDNPRREDLARVAEFLRRAHVGPRDVCFYNSDFVSLHRQLGLRPPTRYAYLHEILVFFPVRRAQIQAELERSGHRYVVTDLVGCGLPRRDAEAIGPEGPLAPPPAYARARSAGYPWSCPVVYRAGTYLVHRVGGE
jgi:hypothetical protein